MLRLMLILAPLFVSACASRQAKAPGAHGDSASSSGVQGSRADVRSRAGTREGFVVEDKCRLPDCYGVRGTGDRAFPGLRPWDRPLPSAVAAAWRATVMRALDDIGSSVHMTGFGPACNDAGLFVWMDDWRAVDPALERLGAMLRHDELQETIGVCVTPRVHLQLETTARR